MLQYLKIKKTGKKRSKFKRSRKRKEVDTLRASYRNEN